MPPEPNLEHRAAIVRAAGLFRLGMDGDASDTMVTVVDGLVKLIADPNLPGLADLNSVVGEVLGAQERGDVLRIADLLEFELLPRLAG